MNKSFTLIAVFSSNLKGVVLVRKQSPEWMKGLLNLPGGKIEATDETPLLAAMREFKEETGADLDKNRIRYCGEINLGSANHCIYVYATVNQEAFEKAETQTWKDVVIKISLATANLFDYSQAMVNLPAIITLCRAHLLGLNHQNLFTFKLQY